MKSGVEPPHSKGYEEKKARERNRQAAIVRTGQDIGPIPPPADPARRAAAELDLQTWAETYFHDRFPLPCCADHSDQFHEAQRVIEHGGLQAIAAPRGDGKTTRLEVAILFAILTGKHDYGVLLTATAKHAPRRIGSVKMALLTNELLLSDYPEVCVPVRAMNGRANKCAGLTSEGSNLWPASNESQWGKNRVILPTVPGSRCSGAVLESSGLLEALRGLNLPRADGTILRPSLLLLDDPQTDRTARSPIQCEAREDAIAKGILFLPGPDREVSALAALTVIDPGDVADKLLDRTVHPAWHGVRKKMLYSFPTNMKLWDEYAVVYLDELATGSEDFPRTTQFYTSSRGAMDEGCVVAWEHRHPGCTSAVEFAMRCFLRDRRAFMSEFQNEPESEQSDAADVAQLSVDQLSVRQGTHARGAVPLQAERLTWFVDVHKDILYYTVCGWAPGYTGWIVDYGTWPQQDSVYFDHRHLRHKITATPEVTATTREGQTQQALDRLFAELSARDWVRVDGLQMSLDLGLVDANDGAVTDAVYESCRGARRKHGLLVTPSHGMAFGAAKCPISRYDRAGNKTAKLGDEWMLPSPKKCRIVRHVVFDAGRRKSFLWRRLTTPLGDPGSLCLFDGEPARHRLFCEHLTAEVPTKTYGPYGEVIVWTLRPGRPNHWLDCLSGCCTAESMLGGKLAIATPRSPSHAAGTADKSPAPRPARQAVRPLDL
jgi:hypothetical protein